MNVLLFLGSPRKKGNTEYLLQAVSKGAEAARGNVELIRLPKLEIHPCIGCGTCEKMGRCIFTDDMDELYEKIAQADRIILGSPIYFYNVTAQTKIFIDRCQALWSKKYILKQPVSPKLNRKGYLVSVSATKGERIFEGARLTSHYTFDAMDCTYADDLLIRGMDKCGAVADNPAALQQAFDFGVRLAGEYIFQNKTLMRLDKDHQIL
jgi:multimeric flavodoxin WrbA